jgi:hypothetical protein
MLFDLRGSGRKRAVKVIYMTLAVLMGSGLVLFGIGGATSGGLLDVFTGGGGGGGGGGGNDLLAKQEKTAQQRVNANPSDATAWATLARLHFQQAGQGDNYDQSRGVFKSGGRRELSQADAAWVRYLKLEQKQPDPNLAALMVQAYAPTALDQPKSGVEAAEIVADARPSAQAFYQLAVFAYSAGQTRKGDLASQKALSLTDKDLRPQLKAQLDQAKAQSAGATATVTPSASSSPPGSGSKKSGKKSSGGK